MPMSRPAVRPRLLCVLLLGATVALGQTPVTIKLDRFEKEILAYEAADRQTPPPADPIVFVGSSSVRLWKSLVKDFAEYNVLNRGFGGSTIRECTYYADRIVTNYKPRQIVLHAGSNDLGAKLTPEQVFEDLKAFVAKVRAKLPDVPLVFSCINPAPTRLTQMGKQREANRLIREWLRTQPHTDYIDAYDCFLDADGKPREELYLKDRLHNNPLGYAIRVSYTRPHLLPVAGGPTVAKFRDPALPVDERVADLVAHLTLEEKAKLLFHKCTGLPDKGVPFFGGWNQCLHGVWSKTPTTCFTASIGMAATWDPALVKQVADAISDEARALYKAGADGPHSKHGLIYRAPVINICRDPRWGRIQESFGEDPFLCGRTAVAYVQGLQGQHPKYLKVAATLKHFAVNNQEAGRTRLSATVPERMLHEYWLPHFKAAVTEGGAQSLMAAYNALNGTPCCLNKTLLTDILRGLWGFEGFVVSDLGGIGTMMAGHKTITDPPQAVAAAVKAGCDLDDENYAKHLPTAVRQGLLDEATLNVAVGRVLRTAFKLGVFDAPEAVPYTAIGPESIDSAAHRALARRLESAAMVLLKNQDNFLPLDRAKLKKVAIIGPTADRAEYGAYFGASAPCVSPLDGLKARFGEGAEVLVARGCGITEPSQPGELEAAVAAAKQADVVLLCLGTNTRVEGEGHDRRELGLPGDQQKLLEAVGTANPRTVALLSNAGPLSVRWAVDHLPAMLEVWYPGEEAGNAIADVLCGDVNPAGRLPYTVYESAAEVPPMTEYDITKGFTYMYYAGTPQFAFGHGLSYTRFEYANLGATRDEVAVDVKNVGARAGDEVVQVYVRAVKPSVKRPAKELRGFARVTLAPGETRRVTVKLPADALAFWDETTHGWKTEAGAYEVLVGASSADVRATATVKVE